MSSGADSRALESVWFIRPDPSGVNGALSPLQCIREALEAMEAGLPIPAPSSRVLVRALRAYLDGTERDITRSLGLRPRRGGAAEVPAVMERRQQLEGLVCRAFSGLVGKDTTRAKRLAEILADPPSSAPVTEAEVAADIAELRAKYAGELPGSHRQILRIVRGETAAGGHQIG